MIKTVNLGKQFGDFWAVRDLNLAVRAGEIYGFLGPNGAGKTTTILMILGILQPTTGEISVFGNSGSPSQIETHCKTGVVSERQFLYPEMTMREYLDFFGDLYRVQNRKERLEELAERVALSHGLDRRLGTFSRGMQQKVGFVRALLHEPELLILDEPVSGLDPMGIRQVRDLIEEENKRGKTIFISSHLLSEIEKLCHRVGIMNNGELLAEDRMDHLVRRLTEEIELELEFPEESPQVVDAIRGFDFVRDVSIDGRFLRLKTKTDQDYRLDVVRSLLSRGQVPVGIRMRSMSLEEAFITITKENISLVAKADG
jgi:ABC-2 type transport system ATP-binding protein